MIFVLARAFANGGSSLTGIEAVSNAVSAFKPPEGRNARRVLVIEGAILGTLVVSISWLAHVAHATPYKSRACRTVLSQEAKVVFGHSWAGTAMWVLVQAATALILYTGGNTSFNGFPFLANFVAEDAFLPRWLTKRGHRLAFSNGIFVLAIVSIALLAVVGSNVNSLVPFYALGVFTAFTMCRLRHGQIPSTGPSGSAGWRYKLVINFSVGVTSLIVVLIFVIVKFTEARMAGRAPVHRWRPGADPAEPPLRDGSNRAGEHREPGQAARAAYLLPPQRLRLHRRFRPGHDRWPPVRAQPARPTSLRAVHFVIDNVQADKAAAGLDAGKPRHPAGLRGLPGPPPCQRSGKPGERRSGAARRRRDRGPAAPQLRSLHRSSAARPNRGQDGGGDQPDPARRRHNRAL